MERTAFAMNTATNTCLVDSELSEEREGPL